MKNTTYLSRFDRARASDAGEHTFDATPLSADEIDYNAQHLYRQTAHMHCIAWRIKMLDHARVLRIHQAWWQNVYASESRPQNKHFSASLNV